MSAAPAITLQALERRWDERVALAGVELRITPGERIALIGPSGSGKTTLLRVLMGSLRASAGRAEFDGVALASMRPAQIRAHRQRCSLVDQGSPALPRLSVHDNVIAGRVATWPAWRTLLSTLWPLERAEVRALLDEVGLADRQWDRADELSGGQQQRVAVARALAGQPALLLADEPTAALDPTTAAEVLRLLARASAERQATLIISTHRVDEVLAHVDRVVGLREGRVFCDLPTAELDEHTLDALYEGSRERT